MKSLNTLLLLFVVALVLVIFLLYKLFNRPQRIKIYNELPPPAVIPTQWWGYGWRPWWRKYDGVPGFGKGEPLPEPKMPVAPKPIIIPKA